MAKTDIAEAFHIIPILPAQYQVFGLCWRGQYYYDKCLAMGCSSSHQICEHLSSALQWIATHKLDIQYISHVLDDFIISNNAYDCCKAQLQQFLHMCADIAHGRGKNIFTCTSTLISGLWARFSEDGSTVPVQQVTKMPFTYSRIFDQTKIHLENFAKYYWHPQLCLHGSTSRTSLPKATDWLDNGGVKASWFHPYHKGSTGRPAHVGRIPCQLQWEDHLHGRTINLHRSIPSVSSSQFGCQTSPCSLHTWSASHINPLPYHPTCQQ